MNIPDPYLEVPPEVAEITLLLPGWQLTALENAAEARGMTSAQLVRRLLRDFILRQEDEELEPDPKLNVSCQW